MAKLFCMQFVLHADMLFLQRSAVLYPAEHFRENCRHFPFNNSQVAVSATTAVYDGLEILCTLTLNTGLRLSDK